MAIRENILFFQQELANYNCKLVAVSKTQPIEALQEAYQAGQQIFGENKAQEMSTKAEVMPKNILWHMIGHLQTNKVKYIAPYVHTIQSVDSLRLLEEINKQALKYNRTINCLLQLYIAKEESKFGLSIEEAEELLASDSFKQMQNITIAGVMGIATNTVSENQIKNEFKELRSYFETLKNKYFEESATFTELSMGMSSDYKLALAEGSTLIRVGSSIFGARNYAK